MTEASAPGVVGEARLLQDLQPAPERIRDVVQGPDGAFYLLIDSAQGRVRKLAPKIECCGIEITEVMRHANFSGVLPGSVDNPRRRPFRRGGACGKSYAFSQSGLSQ
ncbi:MAG: PQQ-dependent sugar dehydrogenase [Steroidobacteraceae bacterium]